MKNQRLPKALSLFLASLLITYIFASCRESTEIISSNIKTVPDDLAKGRTAVKHNVYIADETIKGEFELRNGTLHFKDAKTFFTICEKFGKMKPEERLATSKAMKFKSLLEVQQDFISEMEKTDSKAKAEQVLKKYDDITIIENEVIRFKNIDNVAAALINRKGIVYLGKSLRYYDGLEQVNIENGDESLINNKTSDMVSSQ